MLLHNLKVLDDNLGAGADENLALSRLLGVVQGLESIGKNAHTHPEVRDETSVPNRAVYRCREKKIHASETWSCPLRSTSLLANDSTPQSPPLPPHMVPEALARVSNFFFREVRRRDANLTTPILDLASTLASPCPFIEE